MIAILEMADTIREIEKGAMLLSQLKQPYCRNCKTVDTPQWRKGWIGKSGSRIDLCNACGLKYSKSQFCIYCNIIYSAMDKYDMNVWISCNLCGRSSHIKCMKIHNNISEITDMDRETYLCPGCIVRFNIKNK